MGWGRARLVAVLACAALGLGAAQDDPIELELDAACARADGLISASATPDEAWAALRGLVEWRLAVAGAPVVLSGAPAVPSGRLRVSVTEPARAPEVRSLLQSLGPLEILVLAEDRDVEGGLEVERVRFEAWRAANPQRPWLEYGADPARPARSIAWLPTSFGGKAGPPMAVLLPREARAAFGSGDLARVFRISDAAGFPAVGFELVDARVPDFEAFTAGCVGRRLAIVYRSTVRAAPTLNDKLVGGGIIEGRFSEEEVREIIAWMRHPSAPVLLVDRRPVSGLPPFHLGPLFVGLTLAALVGALAIAAFVFWAVRRREKREPEDPSWGPGP